MIIYSEKQLKDIKILFTILHLRNNFQTEYFCIDRTTNLQFSKMQSEIYGSLVRKQYYAKCINPLYRKFTEQ